MGAMMKRILLALGLLFLACPAAWAATCAVTSLQIKDNAGTTVTVPYVDDGTGSGNCIPKVTANQGTANATPWNENLAQIGGSAVGSGNPLFVSVTNSNANGQATMANSSPVAIASNQSTLPVNTAQVNGVTTLTGAGAVGTGSQRITVGQDSTTIAGSNPGRTYNTIAASQTAQVLSATSGGGTGTTGDYLSHCVVIPTSTSPGVVTILDNSTTIYGFPGGASSLSNLVPFAIPVGALSVSGGWKITTGANLSVVCVGKFS